MLPEPIREDSILPWETDLRIEPAGRRLPGLSIVMPIFNSGEFLEKSVRSLLCNDLSGVEIIIADGGSTDDTPEILDYYRRYFSVLISEPDSGQSDAINKGFAKASKGHFHWLNGDDLVLPNALTRIRQAFAQHRRAQVFVGDAYMVEADFTPINHFKFPPEKLRFEYLLDYASHHLVQPSVFFTKKAWRSCGPVAEDLHYAMDADLFLKMARKYRFVHVPADIAYSVYHEGCKTRGNRAESLAELAYVQARHGGLAQTRKTLTSLVEVINDRPTGRTGETVARTDRDHASPSSHDNAHLGLEERRLAAVFNEIKRRKSELVDVDIESTG